MKICQVSNDCPALSKLNSPENPAPSALTLAKPAPGALLFYPGGISETEILFPYGTARFASVKGPLAGNHFLTVVEGRERLGEVGRLLCWEGAQDISFEA